MATVFLEVKGSRRESQAGKELGGVRIGVADGESGGTVPARGDFWPSESGLTGRRCVSVSADPEVIPGVWFITAQYRAFRAYS
jgi:hypothetical protein